MSVCDDDFAAGKAGVIDQVLRNGSGDILLEEIAETRFDFLRSG